MEFTNHSLRDEPNFVATLLLSQYILVFCVKLFRGKFSERFYGIIVEFDNFFDIGYELLYYLEVLAFNDLERFMALASSFNPVILATPLRSSVAIIGV